MSQSTDKSGLATSTISQLRHRITSGEWPVGSKIPTEPELCELIGVGRSTIREAVRALTTLGMVEPLTSRGTFVRSVTPTPTLLINALSIYNPAELIGLQRALTVEAAQTAAAKRTSADLKSLQTVLKEESDWIKSGSNEPEEEPHCGLFHTVITQASGNRLLIDFDASLTAALHANGLTETIARATEPSVRHAEHQQIFTAIRDQDIGAAAHHMALHLDSALRSLNHAPIVTEMTTLVDTAS